MIDLRGNEYYNSLPKLIQESIAQSGMDFETESELVQFVSNMDTGGGTPMDFTDK